MKVDSVRPGDRVEVTGIFRAIPKRVNPKMRSLRSVYKTHLDVIHYRLVSREGADNNDSSSSSSGDGNGQQKNKGGAADEDGGSEMGLNSDDDGDDDDDGRYKPDPKAYELFSAARLKVRRYREETSWLNRLKCFGNPQLTFPYLSPNFSFSLAVFTPS